MNAASKKGVTYQSLGDGTYRVVGAMRRSAVSGRFVAKADLHRGSKAPTRRTT